jgi:Sulfotransferase domain
MRTEMAENGFNRMVTKIKVLLRHFQETGLVLLRRLPPRRFATVYPDDVFLISYPKSGNTWAQFLVGNLVFEDQPVTFADVNQRIPAFSDMSEKDLLRVPRPRYIKSHEPFHAYYQNVIYIARDPRDVAVSNYHFLVKKKRLPRGFAMGSFVSDFVADRMTDNFGPWADNVVSWLAMGPSRRRFLFLRYEDLLENTLRELCKIAAFLNIEADDARLDRAVQLSTADRMRQLEKDQWKDWEMTKRSRPDIPFVRAAKSGQWAEALSAESVAAIEGAWGPVMQLLGYKLVNDPEKLAVSSEAWRRWEALVRALWPRGLEKESLAVGCQTAKRSLSGTCPQQD